jgi:hypothetical protein
MAALRIFRKTLPLERADDGWTISEPFDWPFDSASVLKVTLRGFATPDGASAEIVLFGQVFEPPTSDDIASALENAADLAEGLDDE